MKKIFFGILILIAVAMSAQFNDPIHINEDLGEVFFRGSDACKVDGNEVFLTFVEAETGNIYFAYSLDGEIFSYTIVETETLDEFTKLRKLLQPTIEIAATGEVVIFYIKETYNSTTLFKAISNDGGQTFSFTSLAEEISSFSSCSDANEILISYHQGTSVPFSEFQYFTNYEKSENDDGTGNGILKFWGADILNGPSHSNDDIWIQQAGGGPNNGLPTFESIVTTSKRIKYATGLVASPPILEDVFPNGYVENVQEIIYEPSADEIASNGIQIGSGADIVYLKINGSSIDCMYGNIEVIGTQEFPVYSWFPHNAELADSMALAGFNWFEESDVVWTNEVTLYDTIWMVGPNLTVADQTYWIPDSELWIEGEVNGMLIIGCAENVSIVGDITYTNTIPGEAPDDPSNPNTSDYFGLVSEKKIFIKYKHKDPFNNMELRADNCDSVMLYGAFAAIGIADTLVYGNLACHYDGLFTPEYQHPHGSTPNFTALSPYTLQDTLYSFVDLHKYIFPVDENVPPEIMGFNLHGNEPVSYHPSCGFPYESDEYINSYPNNDPGNYVYPYGTDYPWYNPVWPESAEDIVGERGAIYLWGSLAQTRRGFIHRSGGDPYNHPNDNKWDLENFHFDGDHQSTGYDKEYHFDSRFLDVTLPNYPKTNTNGETPHFVIQRSEDAGNSFNTIFESTTENFIMQFLDIDIEDNIIMLAAKTPEGYTIFFSLDSGAQFNSHELNDLLTEHQFIEDIYVNTGKGYMNTKLYDEEMVYEFDPITQDINIFLEDNECGYLSDFAVGNSGCKIHVSNNGGGNFHFLYTGEDINVLSENITLQLPISILAAYLSNISINFNEQDSVFLNILNTDYNTMNNTEGELYFLSGSLENLVEVHEAEIIPPYNSLNIYPNPFNPTTTISFSIPKESNVELSIYNIKGQKVKQFVSGLFSAGQHWVVWDGRDDNNQPVGSGIYFYKLIVGDKTIATKKCLLLK